MPKKNLPRGLPSDRTVSFSFILENVLGCKWTIHVLRMIQSGVHRPGQLVKTAKGLSTKVLNERLTKLTRFGLVERHSYPEIPPRVEYKLTPIGKRFSQLLDEIDKLEAAWLEQDAPS